MKNVKKCIRILVIAGGTLAAMKTVMDMVKLFKKMKEYNEKSLFTGQNIKYEVEPFEADSVSAVCSGLKLDFSQAEMKNDESYLTLFGRSAGIKVIVPEAWQVEMSGIESKSGINNRTLVHEEAAPTLNIDYDFKFCGVDICNPSNEADEMIEEESDLVSEPADEVLNEVVEEVVEEEDELEE